jgi:hypothetical protein
LPGPLLQTVTLREEERTSPSDPKQQRRRRDWREVVVGILSNDAADPIASRRDGNSAGGETAGICRELWAYYLDYVPWHHTGLGFEIHFTVRIVSRLAISGVRGEREGCMWRWLRVVLSLVSNSSSIP